MNGKEYVRIRVAVEIFGCVYQQYYYCSIGFSRRMTFQLIDLLNSPYYVLEFNTPK
jgi:hypothetical protein